MKKNRWVNKHSENLTHMTETSKNILLRKIFTQQWLLITNIKFVFNKITDDLHPIFIGNVNDETAFYSLVWYWKNKI